MAASVQTRTPRIFISYSHEDPEVKERLVTHLKVAGADVWDDTRIKPGDEWLSEIEQAMAGADVAILLVSADFLTSRFVLSKEVPVLLERREREGLLVYPVLVEDCAWDQVEWLAKMQIRMWEGKPLPGGRERNTALAGIARDIAQRFKDPSPPPAPRSSTAKLPTVSPLLFGREKELELLDAAWEDANTNIVSLVAFGGVGKTALVSRWLNQKRCRGADRVFGWSFYSQGAAEDRQTSAEPFIEKALVFFGDHDPKQGSAWEKGERLAGLIERHRTLLILDGLEPLQHAPGAMTGQLKEPSLQSLLRTLGRQNRGLCILSTRLAVADLEEFEGTTMRSVELDILSPEAGAAYLEALGVEGTPGELEQASRDFGGHALALGMLGEYLKVVCDGDVRQRDTIGPLMDEEHKGGHARRVMRSYARYFDGQPEGAILRLVGLFDRPADGPAIEVLKAAPAIRGLTGELIGLEHQRWKLALHHLREAKLLAPEDKREPETLDCHPLVREHFADDVRRNNIEAWREAHLRLYQHYSKQGKEYPDSLEEMAPLFAAVYHGCQAARHQEVWDEIYWRRILRRSEAYLLHKLGAFGANLALLANFFDPPWRQPVARLTKADQGWVLSEAGISLRALGRLSEAVEPMEAGLQAPISLEDWQNAAIGAGNLSELHLTLGNIVQAVDVARQSVEYADRSGANFERMMLRTTQADALHQAGRTAEAAKLFAEAEAMQKQRQPQYPLLYSLQGYQYCDLLLAQGQCEEVRRRAGQTLEWAKREKDLLSIALDHLSLGRASAPESAEVAAQLDEAVEGLRKAGTEHNLPWGLLARAAFRRQRGDFAAAQRDLDEAFALASRCGMRRYLTDYHLEQARLLLAQGDRDKACEHLEKAKKLIADTGYHRRGGEAAELETQLGKPFTPPAPPAPRPSAGRPRGSGGG